MVKGLEPITIPTKYNWKVDDYFMLIQKEAIIMDARTRVKNEKVQRSNSNT